MMLQEVNNNSALMWTQLCLSACGIVLNILFLWITAKTKEKRALIDSTIILACAAKSLIGMNMLVELLSPYFSNNLDLFKILDITEFLLDSFYLINLLILNIFRYRVLRNMHTPQDHKLRCHQSKKCILIGIVLIVVCTFTYAVAMWLKDDRGELVRIIMIKIVYTLMKSIPWTLIVTLNFLMLVKISFLLYKRRITVNPEVQNISRHNSFRCRTLLRQFTLSLILQTILFICPSMHIYPVEFVALIFKKYGSKLNDIYSSMRVVLVVLNPAMFSIILQSKYNIVKTCRLEMRRASTAVRNMLDGSVLKNAQKNETSQDKHLEMKSYLVNSTNKHLKQHNIFTVFPPTSTSPSTPNSGNTQSHKSFIFNDSLVDIRSVNSLKSFQDRGDATSFFCPKRFIERLNTTPSVDLSLQSITSSMHSRTHDMHKSPSVELVENLPPLVTDKTSGSLPDVLQHGSTLFCFEQVNCSDRKSSLSRMNSDRTEEEHLPGILKYKHAKDKPLSDSSGDTLSEYDLAEALKFL